VSTRSEAFPGLWLDSAAALKLDIAAVTRKLNEGLATTEHKQFVEQLRKRRSG